MTKKLLLTLLFALMVVGFAGTASAQQFTTITGEVIDIGGKSDSLSSSSGEQCSADDVVVSSENNSYEESATTQMQQAAPPRRRPRRPPGCLLMECWITCNIPGLGNTYESALQCGGTTQQSLRTSCSLAGGTVTTISCRARGFSSNPCAPATFPPKVIPGPLPW